MSLLDNLLKKAVYPFASVGVGYNFAPNLINGNSISGYGYQGLFNLIDGANLDVSGTDIGYNFDTLYNASIHGRHFAFGSGVHANGNDIYGLGTNVLSQATNVKFLFISGSNSMENIKSIENSYVNGSIINQYGVGSILNSHLGGYNSFYKSISDGPNSKGMTESWIDGFRNHYNQDSVRHTVSLGNYGFYLTSFATGRINALNSGFGNYHGYNVYGSTNTFGGYRSGAQASPTEINGGDCIRLQVW